MTSSYNNKHVDTVLNLYKNILLVLNISRNINKSYGGNGTRVRLKRVVLKKYATLDGKNLDYISINSVSEDDTEYMGCENWESTFDQNNNYIPPRSFRLYPEVTKVDIHMKMHEHKKKCVIKNHYIWQ